MIKIGVNGPVLFEKAEKNDKGTLEITFKEDNGQTKPKLSLLDAANEASDTSGNMDLSATRLMLFPPSTEYQNEEIAPEKKIQNLMKFKNQMHHILVQFIPAKNIKWNIIKGLPPMTTDDQFLKAIEDKANYDKVYANIVEQFIEQVDKSKATTSGKKLRLFAVRQSAEKHFPRLRDNFLDTRPFLESFDIPKEKSGMYVKAGTKGATSFFEPDADGFLPKFDEYEIKKGFDNPFQSSSTADTTANTPEEASAVEHVFGQKTEEAIDFTQPASEAAPGDGGMNFGMTQEG